MAPAAGAPGAGAPVVAAPVIAPPAPVVAAAPPPPAARVYFGFNRFDDPRDADKALAEVLAYLTANPSSTAHLAGFHDPSGDVQYNDALANDRAKTVKDAMVAAGIAAERLVIDTPATTTGTGSLAEARRVEVTVSR